jgi:hypothetical protein
MSIIYSLICKHSTSSDEVVTLATYDSATGNYPVIMINLLKKMTGKQTRITYEYGTEYFLKLIQVQFPRFARWRAIFCMYGRCGIHG